VKKDKKKKSKVEETPAPPAPEPEPEPPLDDFGWGSFGSSDKKKKKGKNTIEEPKVEEKTITDPEPEPVDEFAWSSFGTDKKKKKNGKIVIEEVSKPKEIPAPEPEPEPEADDMGWASFSTKKDKKKKGKNIVEEPVKVSFSTFPEIHQQLQYMHLTHLDVKLPACRILALEITSLNFFLGCREGTGTGTGARTTACRGCFWMGIFRNEKRQEERQNRSRGTSESRRA